MSTSAGARKACGRWTNVLAEMLRVAVAGRGKGIPVAALVLATTGCGSPTSPIPEQKLTLRVENYVIQQGVGPAATETPGVFFLVYAAPGVTPGHLSEIRSMSVEWPGGLRWTSIAPGVQASSDLLRCSPVILLVGRGQGPDMLVASAYVPQVVLSPGTYTLHVTFNGGHEVERDVTYDGQVLGLPTAVTVYPTDLGVGIAWAATRSDPPADFQWGLAVKSVDGGATLASRCFSGPVGGTSGWVRTDLGRGTSYVLGLSIVGPFNSRYVSIPFTVPS